MAAALQAACTAARLLGVHINGVTIDSEQFARLAEELRQRSELMGYPPQEGCSELIMLSCNGLLSVRPWSLP